MSQPDVCGGELEAETLMTGTPKHGGGGDLEFSSEDAVDRFLRSAYQYFVEGGFSAVVARHLCNFMYGQNGLPIGAHGAIVCLCAWWSSRICPFSPHSVCIPRLGLLAQKGCLHLALHACAVQSEVGSHHSWLYWQGLLGKKPACVPRGLGRRLPPVLPCV